MNNINDQYRDVASEFDNTLILPFRKYIEVPMTYSLIGDVKGLNVLDLACGTGLYTRYLRTKGAHVQGIDISEGMLKIAREVEEKYPLGIQYIQQDVLSLEKIGHFDLVLAIYLFHYFSTKKQLIKCCKNIFENLNRGGRFLTYVLNPGFKNKQGYYDKYGLNVHESDSLKDGCLSSISFDESDKVIKNYYWSKETLEDALLQAGFHEVKWIESSISESGLQKFGDNFWNDYIKYPRLVHLETFKI